MKLRKAVADGVVTAKVAPCAGAWIEASCVASRCPWPGVAPCAGAWIEAHACGPCGGVIGASPPARGRGLKRWLVYRSKQPQLRRPLRGGVD